MHYIREFTGGGFNPVASAATLQAGLDLVRDGYDIVAVEMDGPNDAADLLVVSKSGGCVKQFVIEVG